MSGQPKSLLFVEDNSVLRNQLAWSFPEYAVATADGRVSGLAAFQRESAAVAVIDLGLPPDAHGSSEGLALLEELRDANSRAKIIVLTGNENRAVALRAIELGAYDFCSKPMDIDMLRAIIQRAFHLYEIEEELRQTPSKPIASLVPGLITASPVMQQICELIPKIASTDISVMLIGESGTGKEVLARAIHNLSTRRAGPFIAINCAAIPENLLESELFGYERGAFTGAERQSIGRIQYAHKGTLLLDEIGDVPFALQVKLLRFLQERVIERVGGRSSIPVDLRVICATHRNLPELMLEHKFRDDLYFRLNEFPVRIPPLRERFGDAILLAQFFLADFSATYGRQVKGFAPEAHAALNDHDWPGNVRELQNRIKRAIVVADGDLITSEDLELSGIRHRKQTVSDAVRAGDGQPTLKKVRSTADHQALLAALAQANGNITQAAKILGVSRPTLYDLMRIHNVRGSGTVERDDDAQATSDLSSPNVTGPAR